MFPKKGCLWNKGYHRGEGGLEKCAAHLYDDNFLNSPHLRPPFVLPQVQVEYCNTLYDYYYTVTEVKVKNYNTVKILTVFTLLNLFTTLKY